MPKLTNDQINRLSQLGINIGTGGSRARPSSSGTGLPFPPSSSPPPSPSPSSAISKPHLNTSNTHSNISNNNKLPLKSALTTAKTVDQTVSSSEPNRLLTPQISPTSSKNNIFPLLSISGLTLLSFGGLVFFKTKTSDSAISNQPSTNQNQPAPQSTPTQVPKSIQHYLLASQQYFSSALQQQSSCTGSDSCDQPVIELLNQSILTATDAIKLFPSDYRGYQQRAKIYQSLSDSQPQLLPQAISDYTQAQQLNPNSAEITRDLAALYAKTGNAAKTITYLTQTVALEPTKAQNFYDLAKIQQQTGLLPQALETYTRLLSLITDPVQRQQVESEKLALENLTKQCTGGSCARPSFSSPPLTLPSPTIDAPTIQALTSDGPIIASTPESKDITVNNQTESNSLSGTSTLPANQSQINIPNTNLTATSQVYLTITKGGKNQTLQVISKTSKSFTVGLDSSIPENIEFKWWIIN